MNDSIYKTEVNLDGLLEVLGKNLYSTPSVALRELIQNAHDACERHKIESQDDSTEYKIHLYSDRENLRLTIQDNGSGLTRDEIKQYLATIGSGYTRVIRNQTQSEHMIGYFGLGFLSAYVVSDKVEVVTTSWQTPDKTWLFSSAGGKSFAVSESSTQTRGTTVTLQLAKGFEALSDERVLNALIKRYCGLLPLSIYLNQQQAPINQLLAPWNAQEASQLRKKNIALEFAQVFEEDFEPLTCITLPEDNDLQLKGVLWIQDGGSYSSSDNRNVSVFIRSMFITNEDHDLIPRWAGFVGGVFESIHFKPTASRESLQKDEYYSRAVEFIREQLVMGLRDIVLKEPETWRRILTRHNQALIGAAVSDDRLFDACRKTLKVPTSIGDLTIPRLLKASGGTIYIKPESRSGYEEILFRAKGVPLVSGYLYGATPFCQLYCEYEGITSQILGTEKDEHTVFHIKEDVPEEIANTLLQAFANDETVIKLADFEPTNIPVILVADREAQLKRRLESDEADKRIGAAALSLARMHTKNIKQDKELKLYINLANPLIAEFHKMSKHQQENLSILLKSFMEVSSKDASSLENNIDKTFSNFNQALMNIFNIQQRES